MKIQKTSSGPAWLFVGDFVSGDVIEMQEPVNQYCRKADLYIIGEIPKCYLRDAKGGEFTSWILADKTPVINLRTGGVSLVNGSRSCLGRPSAVVFPDGPPTLAGLGL